MSKSTRSNLRVVVLVSGRGSNLKALAARADDGTLPIEIVAVASDRTEAEALGWAADGRGLGIVIPGEGTNILGYGQVLMWPSCAEISDMVVHESCRGRGYGTAIIQTLIRRALALGADEVEIGAALDNPRAADLYRRLGFEDSHTVLINLGKGAEHVLFLRLELHQIQTAPSRRE